MDCTKPKKTVSRTTEAAIQKVNHRSPRRRSFHHCVRDFGSDSSKTFLSIQSRNRQYLKFLICRCSALRFPHSRAVGSRKHLDFLFRNHFLMLLSDSGRRSAKVRNVSSINSSSYRLLWVRSVRLSIPNEYAYSVRARGGLDEP